MMAVLGAWVLAQALPTFQAGTLRYRTRYTQYNRVR